MICYANDKRQHYLSKIFLKAFPSTRYLSIVFIQLTRIRPLSVSTVSKEEEPDWRNGRPMTTSEGPGRKARDAPI